MCSLREIHFLDDLRWSISYHHIWQAWQQGKQIYQDLIGSEPPGDPQNLRTILSTNDLYLIRRDLSGVTTSSVVRDHGANESHAVLGAIQLALITQGVPLKSHHFEWNGKKSSSCQYSE